MKIAFIDVTVSNSFGGIQTAVWQLAHELSLLGHDVHIFSGLKEGHAAPDYPGVKLHCFPYIKRQKFPPFGTRFRKLSERLSFAYHARKAFVAEQFDWAIVTKPFDFVWPYLVKGKCSTQFAFMSGGTDFFQGDKHFAPHIKKWLACSHFNAWQQYAHYKKFCTIMFNGVNTDAFSPQEALDQRHKLSIEDHEIVFGYAGRLIGWKGLEFAVRALPHLSNHPVKLLLIGDGPAKESLQNIARELKVDHRVIFHPPVTHHDLPKMINAFDVGVFPSIGDEAFGISIAEAMGCGKPVIASHIGGIPEVVGNEGSCGLLWSCGDIEDLSKKMAFFIENADLRQSMGQAARQRVIERFTWKKSVQTLLQALS